MEAASPRSGNFGSAIQWYGLTPCSLSYRPEHLSRIMQMTPMIMIGNATELGTRM